MSMVLNSQNFYLYTELTHKSDTSNSETYPKSDTLFARKKFSLFGYVKDIGKH